MQTVQFQCGHCGKLMAVSSEHLGQQVRCPHCQQVVIAPPPPTGGTPAPPPPPPSLPETVLHVPAPAGEAENIFSQTDVSEDLFGRQEAPRLEMPLESLPPTLAGDNAPPPEQGVNAPRLPTLASTLAWAPPQSVVEPPVPVNPFAPSGSTAVLPPSNASSGPAAAITETVPTPAGELPSVPPLLGEGDEGGESAAARARKPRDAKAPWFLLLVFCPLLLYAIVISVFAFVLYWDYKGLQEQLRHPFEMMPDVGDDPGVRKGKKVSLTDNYKPELATKPLPDFLCTTLGQPLTLGDLQITPNRVERRRVSVIVGASKPEPCRNDSLVLYLDLKNLSSEYAFAPLDNYFDRYWRRGQGDPLPPLTQLEIGKYRCFGGPAHWYPRGDRNNQREWVQGRRDQAILLGPGEEKQLFVCTDGEDATAAALLFGGPSQTAYRGPFLWRVRVRRGLVRMQNKEFSATAVVGVRFTDKDIR